jgi:U4/U6 small nuclear ribonucleoprotein PRP31
MTSELSLADEFLLDLDELDDGGVNGGGGGGGGGLTASNADLDTNGDGDDDDDDGDDDGGGDNDDDADDAMGALAKQFGKRETEQTRMKHDNVRQVVKLWQSDAFVAHMRRVDEFSASANAAASSSTSGAGVGARVGEYELIVECNAVVFQIDTEIDAVCKFVRDQYSSKFPELESLVLHSMDYVRVVKAIGNEVDLTRIDLTELLPANTIMVVSVTATTSRGTPLSPETLAKVMEACDVALGLDAAKSRILAFVQSRMSAVAPNLSALVGTQCAAKIMAAAGGLAQLSKMAANVVMAIGSKKQDRVGLSNASATRNGFINECPLMINTPPDLRVRAARVIGGRCALAARVDEFLQDTSGAIGRGFYDEIFAKITKWQEAPPGKKVKALPAPVMDRKSRRAGKRVRKLKEKFAYSDMRQAANRVEFAAQGDTYGLEDNELGMLGSSANSGLLRVKADARVGKLSVKKPPKSAAHGGGGSGFASVAFTPVQGLELENPLAAAERAAKSERVGYFDVAGGFNNTFKKPELPPAKKTKLEDVTKPKQEP